MRTTAKQLILSNILGKKKIIIWRKEGINKHVFIGWLEKTAHLKVITSKLIKINISRVEWLGHGKITSIFLWGLIIFAIGCFVKSRKIYLF